MSMQISRRTNLKTSHTQKWPFIAVPDDTGHNDLHIQLGSKNYLLANQIWTISSKLLPNRTIAIYTSV